MKNFLFLLLISAFAISNNQCKTKAITYTAVVTALPDNTEGEIFLRSNGNGTAITDATITSEKNAFNSLLFRGITNSQQLRPLVEDEATSRSQNKAFYIDFFDKRGYNKFIIYTANTKTDKLKGANYVVTSDIRINLFALRSYLEQQGVIRKFGF